MTVSLIKLDRRYLDKASEFTPSDYCPGFDLWDVLASDGAHYLMAGDYIGGVGTRLHFQTDGALSIVSAINLGPNPAVKAWDTSRL